MDFLKLRAVLGFDSSEYEKGLDDAKSKASSVGGAIVGGLKTVAKVGAAAIGAATTAVTGFAASSIKVGADFDSSMSQIAATLGLTIDDIKNNVDGAGDVFDALREKAREMGGSTIYSASEAAEGLNILAMSGYDAEQSMTMLEDVLHLAAAGSMDMASAAAYVSGSMKGFNDSSKDSAYYADLMAKGATLANTNVQQLGEAMSDGAASAAAYNQSADSMTVALLRLAEQGEVGSAAGTALAAAMKNIYTGTDQAKAALQELGVEAYDPVTHAAKDFNQVVNELEASMQGMTDEEKNNYKQTIFGIQGLNAYNKMVVSGKEKQDEWANALANATGEAARQYDTMTGNLDGAIKGWNSALDDFRIEISDKLTPTFSEFVDFGTTGLQKITKAFQKDGLSGAVKAFGDVIADEINMILTELPGMIDAGMQLLGALGQGILENAPLLLTTVINIIEQLADGFISATPVLMNGIASMLPDLMSAVVALIVNLAEAISNPDNLTEFIEGAVNIILALAQGLLDNLPTLIEAVPVIIENLVNALIENAPVLILSAISLLGMIAQSIIENLPLIIAAGIQIITALTAGIIQMIPFIITAVLGLISELTRTLIASLPKFLENGVKIVGAIVEGIVKTLGAIIEAAINLVNQFIDGMARGWGKIIQAGMDIIDKVRDGLMDKIDEARDWGKDLIDNFIDGIEAKAQALWDTVSGIAQGVKDFLGFSEPEKGPLSNFHTYAPDMMDLFAKGIRDNKNMLINTVADAFDFQDLIAAPNIETSMAGNDSSNNQNSSQGETNVIMNIYGAVGQDINELADIISKKLNDTTGRRMVAMGVM